MAMMQVPILRVLQVAILVPMQVPIVQKHSHVFKDNSHVFEPRSLSSTRLAPEHLAAKFISQLRQGSLDWRTHAVRL